MRDRNPWTARWLVIAAVATLATLAACIETTPPPNGNQPVIVSFGAEPSDIAASDSSTLSWTVTGNGVTLDVSAGDTTLYQGNDLTGSTDVTPIETTTYTLTATNTDGSVDADVTVTITAPTGDAPVIVSFVADPSEIMMCDSSTLSWTVTGNDVTLAVSAGDTTLYQGNDLTSSTDVTPTTATTYTLTATNTAGSVDADVAVTVTGPSGEATLTGLSAQTIRQSHVALTWSVDGAACVMVYAATSSAPDADATLVATIAGDAERFTMPIPTSDRQTVRVCAVSGADPACLTTPLSNVVTDPRDYDPYYLEPLEPAPGDPARDVPWPEPEIPGTLRSTILNADEGAVIGFAADIDHILIRGVDLLFLDGPGYQDAHLILERNVTISAPTTGVTLEGVTAWQDGNPPGEPFTYRSRLIYVVEGTTVTLEHLTITGGTFIYRGGGIRNDGNLTVLDSTITENRAWEVGGGIWNNATGTLLVERSAITDNQAVTSTEELEDEANYLIRRDPDGYEIFMFDTGVGGGLFNQAGGSVTLVDSVVQGNVATEFGGGIYTEAGATTHLDDTIVTGNTPSDIVQASASASTSVGTSSSHVVENERVRTR